MITVYVSPMGDDSSDGRTPQTPLKSIGRAIGTYISDCTILLEGGAAFSESVIIQNKHNFAVGSYGIGTAAVTCDSPSQDAAVSLINCKNIRISGISIIGGGWNKTDTGGLAVCDCNDVVIENTQVTGFKQYGIMYYNSTNVLITGCYTYRNGSVGICSGGGANENITISHCKTHDNPGNHDCTDNHSGSGIIVSHTRNALIEFCEAAGNGWAQRQRNHNGPVGIWCWGDTHGIVMRYNIAHHNRTQPGAVDGDGFDIDGGVFNGLFEYNYSYSNEAAGYLLCEYGSGMGWENNNIRCCASIGDITRISGYGAVHFYGPEGIPMRGSEVQKSLFMPYGTAYGAAVKDISKDYTDVSIHDNVFVAPAGIFSKNITDKHEDNHEDTPRIEEYNNINLTLSECRADVCNPPRLTDPRKLPHIPLFGLLENGNAADAMKNGGYRALFGNLYPASDTYDTACWFTYRLNGSDTEGSAFTGDVSLAYDSLKPGTVTKLRCNSEIYTYIPAAYRGGRYTLNAYGRLENPADKACLFAREASGREHRQYITGSVSDYNMAELTFECEASGVVFGVRHEEGYGSFLVDRIDVYCIEDNTTLSETSKSVFDRYTATGNAYVTEENTFCVNGGGSSFISYAQSDDPHTYEIIFEAMAEGISAEESSNAFFFCKQGEKISITPITSSDWREYTVVYSSDSSECITFGFAVSGSNERSRAFMKLK